MFKVLKNLSMIAAAVALTALPILQVAKVSAATANLITNPGVETTTNGFTENTWSTNTRVYTYLSTGHSTAGSMKTEVTKLGTGGDGWSTPSVALTAGQSYEFSFWYQASVAAELDSEVMVNGVATPRYVASLPASAAWTQYKTTYTAAAGETSIIFTPLVIAVGTLTTDDFSFNTYSPTPLARPIVSVTFDDGWANQYLNGRQTLKDNGINPTFYLISDPLANGLGTPQEYMSVAQANDLFKNYNAEIASHTIDHCSLSGATKDAACTDPSAGGSAATQFVTNEMTKSQTDLQTMIPGAKVTNFAYPYGEYTPESVSIGKNLYTSQRTVECGYNTKDSLDLDHLKGCEVDASSTVAGVEAQIDTAIAQKSWLVLFYHEIADSGQGVVGDEAYTTPTKDFNDVMKYIHDKQAAGALDNMTVANAITAVNGGTVTTPAADLNAVYRMANYITKERLFTTDLNEVNTIRDKNGWVYEGVSFHAATTGAPVYRMANWMTHERLFTTDLNEVNTIRDKNGWVAEGTAFYAPATGAQVYRMANYITKERLFTTDLNEVNTIRDKNGWVYENVAFFAQ